MSRRSEFRNEVKTRLRDRAYDALQLYKQVNGIESDSAALARIAEQHLFGAVGTLPVAIGGVSDDLGHFGTPVTA
ncbi:MULTISPECIES: hypothetical protein [Cupriavidus]|uniref:Uncharacterized protein n=1 Tax=Cupriavidus taiwanensis TaxID=164546 RepID=A0A375IY43_9BURK|nr:MULTISPECIES: hypothetical protein [Cupriavidus]GLC92342.1 hypothetical protein Tamer19_17500 [Cupriavidus sp. TA19]SPR97379.1 conserved hypothetical protein [Cupriavidus taiwanensis]